MSAIAEDENKSFGEIFACFDTQTLNLGQIMNWPVTNKPYSICSEDGKVKANIKSLFRNKSQSLCLVESTNFAPKCVSTSVADAMRVVRIIPIKGNDPPLYSTWAKKLFAYIENLPGNNIHIVFDNYNCEGDQFISLSKERLESSTERNSSLNQVLPNANEWSEFLSNRKNKLQLCNLLADYFTSGEIATEEVLFVTKEKICYIKHPDQIRQVCPLRYSEHKEEDHRIASHAKYASDNDNENSSITIVVDDTDIYICLIRIACYCRSILYFLQGTSSGKAGITYHVSAAASEFGESECKILPSFHALTGSDFTKTFNCRSKIQNFKKMLTQPSAINLLFSLATLRLDVAQIIDFVLHIVYNRPKREKTPGESRFAMLVVKKREKEGICSDKTAAARQKIPAYENIKS